MEELIQSIRERGQILPGGILRVDSFLNHMVDPGLIKRVGEEFARTFNHLVPTLILTSETSGIIPALATGMAMGTRVLYAKKTRSATMRDVYSASAPSHTKGGVVELSVSRDYLKSTDRVLIIDDFLASGKTLSALIDIIAQADAAVVGIGAVIEKKFEGGRQVILNRVDIPVYSLAVIFSMGDDGIELE